MSLRAAKTTHKYGIEVPCTVAEALKLGEINDSNLWRDAIQKKWIMLKLLLIFYQMTKNFHLDIRKLMVILFLIYE